MRAATPIAGARIPVPPRLAAGGAPGRARRRAPRVFPRALWRNDDEAENDDDVEAPVPMVSSRLRAEVSAFYDGAVRRALADPFMPYENLSGIINLAECETSAGWSPREAQDEPDCTRAELVDATVTELAQLFGQSGVEATPALAVSLVAPGVTFDDTSEEGEDGRENIFTDASSPESDDGGDEKGDGEAIKKNARRKKKKRAAIGASAGGGFVWTRLTPFQDAPTWEGEADLHASLVETYGVLLAPGMLRGASEPGWFLMCVAGRDEETLLTGVDRLRTQLLQRKFLHGRW